MRISTSRFSAATLILLITTLLNGCGAALVVVPRRDGTSYTESDTLHGRLKDRDVRVTFRHLSVARVDTVVQWRTI